MVRWGVPVFVMISGALFLNRPCDIKKLYGKYIPRMITAYLFWSFLYALDLGEGVKQTLGNAIAGKYHMWFVPMIIGLYIALPVTKKIAEDPAVRRYFLALSFAFAVLIPYGMDLASDFGPHQLKTLVKVSTEVYEHFSSNIIAGAGYTFYFVLGYELNQIEIGKKTRRWLYAAGIAGCVLTVVLNAAVSLQKQKATETYSENFMLNVLLQAVAIFVFFRNIPCKSARLNGWAQRLAAYSFGAYMVHVMVIDTLCDTFKIDTFSIHPLLSVPAISLIVFAASMAISALLNHIPVVKKYIV